MTTVDNSARGGEPGEPIGTCVYCQTVQKNGYRQPRATVLRIEVDGDWANCEIRVEWGTWKPTSERARMMPGSLWSDAHPHDRVMDLHRLDSIRGDVAQFSTFAPDQLPAVGATYVYGSWWIPDALELVEDRKLHWRQTTFDRPDDHDHCLLCWKTFGADEERAAFVTSERPYDPVCTECFSTFIEHGPPWARRPTII